MRGVHPMTKKTKNKPRAACDCGNKAVKTTSDGGVCERCIEIESRVHQYHGRSYVYHLSKYCDTFKCDVTL